MADTGEAHVDEPPRSPEEMPMEGTGPGLGIDLFPEEPWMDEAAEAAMRSIVPHHMDSGSAILYGRWWQLERWLRSLVYVDLRALRGRHWVDAVKMANGRLQQDAAFTHMSAPDNDNPLAYLDYTQLVRVVDEFWDNLGYALFDKVSWDGRQSELTRIRHRIGHMRRPHFDDVSRLEQTLRDLERGAFIAFASYNDREVPGPDEHDDPVTRGWIKGDHEDARRLLQHAQRQYDTRLVVRASRRPWAVRNAKDLTEAPGYLWHADFFLRSRSLDISALWRDVKESLVGSLLVHLEVRNTNHVAFTFSAADDAEWIADAIGNAFDYVLTNSSHYGPSRPEDYNARSRRYRNMDYRIVSGDGWTIVDETTVPISNFGAGGGVTSVPRW